MKLREIVTAFVLAILAALAIEFLWPQAHPPSASKGFKFSIELEKK